MVASRSLAVPVDPHRPGGGSSATAASLRTLLESRRADKTLLSLGEAAGLIVPLCLDLQQRHASGEQVLLHPSCVESHANDLARFVPRDDGRPYVPENPRDRACIPPELMATMSPGGARQTVYSIGAILYECVTGGSVGPGMARPRDVNPKLPEALEILLAKALVSNPGHRPDDLGALASALHNLAPKHSIHPPDVDEGRLDHGDDFEVDIKLSMLPLPSHSASSPALRAAPVPRDAYGQPEPPPSVPPARPSAPNLIERLALLKKRLESDPRPRYVVSKDRMDHGPFSAVELLQQIAANGFVADDLLRDELSGQTRPIKEWDEFSPFSEQAALKRDVIEEKRVVAQVAQAEKKAGLATSTIGIAVVLAIAAGASIWFFTSRGSRNDEVSVENDSLLEVHVDGGIKGQKKSKGGGGHGGGGGGYAGGMSYDQALAANPQQMAVGGPQGGPDLSDQQLSGPMRNAAFLDACNAPQSMHVTVKTVVKMGHAIGVTVLTTPPNGAVAACIDRSVRNLAWPVNGKADSFVTNY
jgi:hypothetical protein